jgi:hypothetical protein
MRIPARAKHAEKASVSNRNRGRYISLTETANAGATERQGQLAVSRRGVVRVLRAPTGIKRSGAAGRMISKLGEICRIRYNDDRRDAALLWCIGGKLLTAPGNPLTLLKKDRPGAASRPACPMSRPGCELTKGERIQRRCTPCTGGDGKAPPLNRVREERAGGSADG